MKFDNTVLKNKYLYYAAVALMVINVLRIRRNGFH